MDGLVLGSRVHGTRNQNTVKIQGLRIRVRGLGIQGLRIRVFRGLGIQGLRIRV